MPATKAKKKKNDSALVKIAPELKLEQLPKMKNEELINTLVITAYELQIARSDLHDFDDYPIADQYSDEDVEALNAQLDSLKHELTSRMTTDAEMKRLIFIAEELQRIRKIYEEFRASGINLEVMVYYIYHKSNLNISDIRAALKGVQEFFQEAYIVNNKE